MAAGTVDELVLYFIGFTLITDFRNSQIVVLSMQSKDNATDMWPDKHYHLLTVLIMLCVDTGWGGQVPLRLKTDQSQSVTKKIKPTSCQRIILMSANYSKTKFKWLTSFLSLDFNFTKFELVLEFTLVFSLETFVWDFGHNGSWPRMRLSVIVVDCCCSAVLSLSCCCDQRLSRPRGARGLWKSLVSEVNLVECWMLRCDWLPSQSWSSPVL